MRTHPRSGLDKSLVFKVDVYSRRVTIKRVLGVELGLASVALPTEGHVHVGAANQRVALLGSGPKREAGILLAKLADSRQLLYLLALGNQGDDVGKCAAQEGALKGRDDDYLLFVGRHF